MNSLQWRLAGWLSAAILTVAVASGILSFANAFEEAHELQDAILRQVAAWVRPYDSSDSARANALRIARETDPESHLLVQVLGHEETGAEALSLPAALPEGLQTVHVGQTSYRVLVRTLADGERVAVAQATSVRDEIARSSAFHTVVPLMVLVPTLVLVTVYLVRKALRPVSRLARDVDQRRESDLHPLAMEELPMEIRPFVTAINRLLKRVEQAMTAQRRFVADAAHELRTPLAALSLQSERLSEAEMSQEARARLQTLRLGIARERHLLEQLLSLARAQAPVEPWRVEATLVSTVYRRVLEDLMPLAESKGIDLGLGEVADVKVPIGELELTTIVKNLVDNAIRYTPAGGHVDVCALDNGRQVELVVEDNGPGIPEQERARVLDPFYRVLGTEVSGTGLGLSIVRSIVERSGGTVELASATQAEHGLRVRVLLSEWPQE